MEKAGSSLERIYSSESHPGVFVAFAIITLISTAIPGADWDAQLAFMGISIGLLACVFPQWNKSTKITAITIALIVLSFSCFLPREWFGDPTWRTALENAGVHTGSRVVIQAYQSLEQYIPLLLLAVTALWLSGHQISSKNLRLVAVIFVVGVFLQIILFHLLKGQLPEQFSRVGHIGFFPNRNHYSTLLSMAVLCSAGYSIQAFRDKNVARGSLILLVGLYILWTLFSQSMSRAGIILSAAGITIWFLLLGFRYFGQNGIRIFGLMAFLGIGVFFLAESGVKDRLDETVIKLNELQRNHPDASEPTTAPIDFRVPIMKDTLNLIRDFPVTGVGAGQFVYVFPQYRLASAQPHDAIAAHPESDWLQFASELGLPLTIGSALFVLYLYIITAIRIRNSRDRALRTGCLVASALLPLHGLMDVPAHRPALLLTAILLFLISRPSSSVAGRLGWTQWPVRVGAVAMVIGGLLVTSFIPNFGNIRLISASQPSSYRETVQLYRDIQTSSSVSSLTELRQKQERIVQTANTWTQTLPLEAKWYHLKALSVLPFEHRLPEAEHAFQTELLLMPNSIQLPLRQATAWANTSPQRIAPLWDEAHARARHFDQIRGHGDIFSQTVDRTILRTVNRNPSLRKLWEETQQ